MRVLLLTVFLLGGPLLAGCREVPPPIPPPAPADTSAVDRLLALMGERLALMHDVARWKWTERKPVADPGREQELLDAVCERGAGLGLDRNAVRQVFTAQIEAAKLIQQADFDRWRSEGQGPFSGVVPLAELRRRIDVINGELLQSLAATRDVPPNVVLGRAGAILRGDGVTPGVREAATAPWREPPR